MVFWFSTSIIPLLASRGNISGGKKIQGCWNGDRDVAMHISRVSDRQTQTGRATSPPYNTKLKGLTGAPHLLFSIIIEGGAAPKSATSVRGFLEFQRDPRWVPTGSHSMQIQKAVIP